MEVWMNEEMGEKILRALTTLTNPSKVFLVTGFISLIDVPEQGVKRGDLVALVQKQPPNTGYFHVISFGSITEEQQ
jgi:hypothetical protein